MLPITERYPKPIENYLISVNISTLDFYPQGFEAEAAKGLPFRKHKKMSEELTDSLYYGLSDNSVESTKEQIDKN